MTENRELPFSGHRGSEARGETAMLLDLKREIDELHETVTKVRDRL
jgi:hypothetical protein